MVVNMESGLAVGRSVAFFEEEADTAKVKQKSMSEKMLDELNARDEELQRLTSIQARIAFFEAASRQHIQAGEEKQIDTLQAKIMGGVAENHTHQANLGGVAEDHTHQANLGGFAEDHTHQEKLGGVAEDHTHQANLGGVAEDHTHQANLGGVAEDHTHPEEIIGGVAEDHTHPEEIIGSVMRRSLQSFLEEELEQERCALANNVSSFVEVKTGRHSSFKKLTGPKGWKKWWKKRFCGCFFPSGSEVDDRSVQSQSEECEDVPAVSDASKLSEECAAISDASKLSEECAAISDASKLSEECEDVPAISDASKLSEECAAISDASKLSEDVPAISDDSKLSEECEDVPAISDASREPANIKFEHGLHENAEVEKQEISKPKGRKLWWTPSCARFLTLL